MVTNTAGSATDLPATKENGNCNKDNNSSEKGLKRTLNESVNSSKVDSAQDNDSTMSLSANLQEKLGEDSNFNQTSNVGGIASSGNNYGNKNFTNGLPPLSAAEMNGPIQHSSTSFSNYAAQNHSSQLHSGNLSAPRPLQGGQNYQPSMHQRYPQNQQAVSTPTLNHLLTTPSRNPTPFPSFGNQPNHQSQMEYGQQLHQHSWSSKPPHDRVVADHLKPDHVSYASHQQYPASQHSTHPSHYSRYPASAGSQQPYAQQQYNNSGMSQPGYPTAPGQPRHPNYPNFSGYNNVQQAPYYSQRPIQPQSGGFQPPTNNHIPPPAEPQSHHMQQQQPEQSNLPGSDKLYQQSKDNIMSPTQAPSPMNQSSHTHPAHHPSVAHFRGPSSTPGSPGVASQHRSTPLSPSVRSDSSQPPAPMRPASGHSEHSNPPVPSPISAVPNYGGYRSHAAQQQPYGWQPHSYPQHMMSPQHQPSYSSNQPHSAPHHQGPPHMRPPGVGKPTHPMSQAASHPQTSSTYPQPGGQMPYDNMAQPPPVMQGYTSASPAPTERRPSRQGSQPPAVHTPDPNSRQGAAAAAATAAMIAAAHSAQLGSVSGQKSQTPSYYPQPQPQQLQQPQQQRMQLPNFNNQPQSGIDPNQQTFPRISNPGGPASAPQRAMAPPGMGPNANQGNYRMPPPSHPSQFPTSYGQPMAYQHGSYSGYYPPNDVNHPRAPRPAYHPAPNFQQQPHAQEEPAKKPHTKTVARSASQKLAALFEPADEPGRREFIEGLLRYWEEKEVPLKNAPLMGRKTLDLYRLYQVIKEKGGMVEVTGAKKWPEISTMLGLGSTSTSGFTLKKQYCKYLYGYECKVGRGIPEPQEALTRITEANRKRKQLQENSKSEQRQATNQQAPPMHPQPSNVPPHPSHPYNNSQYPPNQYPLPGQHYQMPPPPPSQVGSNYPLPQSSTSLPHPGYPRHPGPANAPAPPTNSYPNPPQGVATTQSWPQTEAGQPSQHIGGVESGPGIRKNEPIQMPENGPKLQQTFDAAAIPSMLMKPRAPSSTTVATADLLNESPSAPRPPNSVTHPSQNNQLDGGQGFPRPSQDPLRHNRPAMLPTSYPYNNSSLPRSSPFRGPSVPGEMHSSMSPAPRPPYQAAFSRPGLPSVATTSYPGLKRPSSDNFAPPRKFMRPDGSQNFPPSHPSFRPDMMRPRYPTTDSPSGGIYRPLGPGIGGALPMPQQQSRLSSPYAMRKFPGYPANRFNRGFPNNRTASLKMRQTHSPLATNSTVKYPSDQRPSLKKHPHAPRSQQKKEQNLFPPGSVEATSLKISKFRPKTCQSVGLVESWPLIMALKSGLLVESTWALNALNILLFDQRSIAQFRLTQLPGLLDSVVEHFRRCLSEIFFLPSELDALGVPDFNSVLSKDSDAEVVESDEQCAIKRARQWRKKRKVSKFKGKHATCKVKVESRSDSFLLDNGHLWDDHDKVDLNDDLSHIILTVSKRKLYEGESKNSNEGGHDKRVPCIEATLEDMLSIPCAVLSPDDFDVSAPPSMESESKDESTTNEVEADDRMETNVSNVETTSKEDSPVTPISNPETSNSKCDDEKEKSGAEMNDLENRESPDVKADVDSRSSPAEKKSPSLRNGLQVNFTAHDDRETDEKTTKSEEKTREASDNTSQSETADNTPVEASLKEENNFFLHSSIIDKVKQIMCERNVVLFEDEAVGSDGRFDSLSGPVFSASFSRDRIELSDRLLAISNIIRSLSFIHANVDELLKHRSLMRALAGILLLRHKHKLRSRENLVSTPVESERSSKEKEEEKCENAQDPEVKSNKCRSRACKTPPVKVNCVGGKRRKSKTSRRKSATSELFAPEEEEKVPSVDDKSEEADAPRPETKCVFSSTILDSSDSEKIYEDPWWWSSVRRLREDALVTLANMSVSVDLSTLPDDRVPLAILEACLHWIACPSSDACDSFSDKIKEPLSVQRISLEILAKLSIKDQNVDLILALRPFSKVEKLFFFLVTAIGDRNDPVLREFSIILVSNLSRGSQSAGRSIALQNGAISNLVAFLEECEERGHNHRQMFRHLEANCGTTIFIMVKAASTLHSLALISENKPNFMKHQLRLLSLAMSHVLSSRVTSVISSLLFELSSGTRDNASTS